MIDTPVKIYKRERASRTFRLDDRFKKTNKELGKVKDFLSKHMWDILFKWGFFKNDIDHIVVDDWTLDVDIQKRITHKIMDYMNSVRYIENVRPETMIAYVGRDVWYDLLKEGYEDGMPMHGYRTTVRHFDEYRRVQHGMTVQMVPWMNGILVVPKKMLHN